jgi:putative ABC transport system substrate-binding protein
MRRRNFIFGLASITVARPLAARAQQPVAMPVIGFLASPSRTLADFVLPAFRQGLKDNGYVEGENVAIEYRWAENQIDQLPALAADLVRRHVAVIVARAPPATLASKAASATIPIVFGVGDDPVKIGLISSLARPGGNLTGANFFAGELAAKRMELLREMVPTATRVAVLGNPNFTLTETQVRDADTAARAMGLQIQIINASTAPRSTRPLQALSASGPAPSTSAPVLFSAADVSNSLSWPPTTGCPRCTGCVHSLKPVG